MKKILFVDDDIAMIRIYQLHFQRAGFECRFFQKGAVAIDALEVFSPDLAVLDYDLPDMKGSAIQEVLKNSENLKQIPVIFVTGQGRKSVAEQLQASGVVEVFSKPFSPSRLVKKVRDLLV